ncbi:MAG TPA: ArdC-like ssDNA-binding domain-containing protein [Anaerolineae bacterium]|nr:ArdC-like ssDNA-binding domain-containing protein [Anaerolineae bacterium]
MKLSARAAEALQEVKERLVSGDVGELVRMAIIARHPDDKMPSSEWSFNNRLLVLFQTMLMGKLTMDCRGYRQWQETGRQVQKGSKAVYILVPIVRYEKDEVGEIEMDEHGNKKISWLSFKAVSVFPDWETKGDGLPKFDYTPAKPPPLAGIAERFGIAVEYVPEMVGAYGNTTVNGKVIALGSHEPRVFFHELGHAVHARIAGNLKGGQDPEQEAAAEFTAAVLGAMYGYDYTGNARDYIAGYNGDVEKAVSGVLGTVEKILSAIEAEEV